MKVYGFNCFGVCICRIDSQSIEEWNAKHTTVKEKIVWWKE